MMELVKYEYDLGMSTICYNCGESLKEDATVAKERYYSEQYKRWFTDYYCLTCSKVIKDGDE